MSTPPSELDRLCECLRGLADDHRRLLDLVGRHEAAIRTIDAAQVDLLNREQEAVRTRILHAEARRRLVAAAAARAAKLPPDATLSRLAAAVPSHRLQLLALRDDLRTLAQEVRQRTAVTAKIAQAMLGHLNTAVRLLASAVERGGTYTKQGAPKLTRRIGSMEAVG
ncbi:MAG TPA: flagellar export chaperone FlgN [Humisphaera sp.]